MNYENSKTRLDKLNIERVETTKQRVAHAIILAENPVECLKENRIVSNAAIDISHAVNLLEAAAQEFKWACQYFGWDIDCANQIDDACAYFGRLLAELTYAENRGEEDMIVASLEGQRALNCLGKALASLIRWFDDDQDVSEV